MIALLVAVAGGSGAVARYALDSYISRRWPAPLPMGTVVVNVTGSFILGLLTGWALATDSGDVLTVLGVGFLGGYTTFSTASVEAMRLMRSGRGVGAAVHAVGMLVLGLGAAMIGLWLAAP